MPRRVHHPWYSTPKAHAQSDHEKTSVRPKGLHSTFYRMCQSHESVKVMKDKEPQRNCHTLEETKETWQKNARWHPGLDLIQRKGISGKTSENQWVLQHWLIAVQKGVNTGPYTTLRKVCLQGGLWLASGELEFWEYSHHFLMYRVAYCADAVCSNNIVYAEHFLSF